MSNTTKKRTLDAFFKPPPKKAKVEGTNDLESDNGVSLGAEDKVGNFTYLMCNIELSLNNEYRRFNTRVTRLTLSQYHICLLQSQPV